MLRAQTGRVRAAPLVRSLPLAYKPLNILTKRMRRQAQNRLDSARRRPFMELLIRRS